MLVLRIERSVGHRVGHLPKSCTRRRRSSRNAARMMVRWRASALKRGSPLWERTSEKAVEGIRTLVLVPFSNRLLHVHLKGRLPAASAEGRLILDPKVFQHVAMFLMHPPQALFERLVGA